MMALLVLMAGALLGVCRASLPPAVGNDNCQPDELSPAFSLPLLPTNTSNETFYLTVDPTQKDLSGQPLPLVLLAINRSDPWTSAMLASNASLDQFLTEAAPDRSTTRFGGRGRSSSSSSSGGGGSGGSTHYAFADHGGDAASLLTVKARLEARMAVLGLSDQAMAAWGEKLHWVAGDHASWGAAAEVLSSWKSPINTLVLNPDGDSIDDNDHHDNDNGGR